MFEQDKIDGKKTEEFFEQYGKALLFPPHDHRIPYMLKCFDPAQGYFTDWPEHSDPDTPLEFNVIRKSHETIHVEGADLEAWIMNPDSKDKRMEHGWIEVKAVKNNGMILYGRNGFPSIPFEIVSQKGGLNKGWLWDLLHPFESCEKRRFMPDQLRTLSPSALVFCQYESEIQNTSPYAVISFYDFSWLTRALIEIANERYGIDLMQWIHITRNKDMDVRWSNEFHSPYWNVSLKWLVEKHVPMAITIIGDEPNIANDKYHDFNIRKYRKLKEMAAAHYNLEDLKGRHEELKIPDQEPEWTT